eukprot:SAG11_NODE_34044_length_274_cov_0.588571_1_plen_91_part_11
MDSMDVSCVPASCRIALDELNDKHAGKGTCTLSNDRTTVSIDHGRTCQLACARDYVLRGNPTPLSCQSGDLEDWDITCELDLSNFWIIGAV